MNSDIVKSEVAFFNILCNDNLKHWFLNMLIYMVIFTSFFISTGYVCPYHHVINKSTYQYSKLWLDDNSVLNKIAYIYKVAHNTIHI